MDNIDKFVINRRSELYQRVSTFVEMSKKHKMKKCNCSVLKKKCNCFGIIDLDKFDKEDYIKDILESGQLEALFNIILSVTNSLKSKAGKDFEKCIEEVFGNNKVDYAKQVYISNDGIITKTKPKNKQKIHSVDIMIPPPEYGTHIEDYIGDVVSIKTTLRERYLQDKYLKKYNCRIVIISLEEINDSDILSIKVDVEQRNLHNYIMSLKNR